MTKYFNRNGKVLKVNYTHNGLLHLVMHFNGPFGLPVIIFFSFIKVNNAHFSFDLQLNKLKFSVGFELGSVDWIGACSNLSTKERNFESLKNFFH